MNISKSMRYSWLLSTDSAKDFSFVQRITLAENTFVDNYLKNILYHFVLKNFIFYEITLFLEDLSVPLLDVSQRFQVPASACDIVRE